VKTNNTAITQRDYLPLAHVSVAHFVATLSNGLFLAFIVLKQGERLLLCNNGLVRGENGLVVLNIY